MDPPSSPQSPTKQKQQYYKILLSSSIDPIVHISLIYISIDIDISVIHIKNLISKDNPITSYN